MSEYTKYFAVKSSSKEEVRRKLNDAKIKSIVDADIQDFWFSSKYKRGGHYSWVVVCAPSDFNFDEIGNFSHSDVFSELKKVFNDCIMFFQEENMIDWNIKIKSGNEFIEKGFEKNQKTIFDENDRRIFSKCFDKNFADMEPLLKGGKSSEFLNFVGIPYMEMNDRDMIHLEATDEKYSFFSEELG